MLAAGGTAAETKRHPEVTSACCGAPSPTLNFHLRPPDCENERLRNNKLEKPIGSTVYYYGCYGYYGLPLFAFMHTIVHKYDPSVCSCTPTQCGDGRTSPLSHTHTRCVYVRRPVAHRVTNTGRGYLPRFLRRFIISQSYLCNVFCRVYCLTPTMPMKM